ncbi:MAG: epoxyqueuosine reductase QueH, partial [Cetobacterium sp.]
FLMGDFKKKSRYLRSVNLSKEHDLYRQDYCGCIYSKLERLEKEKEKDMNNGKI